MSFYGTSFSVNGISCTQYGLMLYDFGSTTQGNSKFASVEISEDRLLQRDESLFYGVRYTDPLELTLVFGAGEYSGGHKEPLDRLEIEAISSWLRGEGKYQIFRIDQPDLAGIYYRGIVTDLEVLEVGMMPWAFKCQVKCDSPYAHTDPITYQFEISGSLKTSVYSRSASLHPYFPVMNVTITSGDSFSIVNHSDHDRQFMLSGLPTASGTIQIDGSRGIILSSSGLNLYPYFNWNFPRLIRGNNDLTIAGSGLLSLTCAFPADVGG